MYIPDPIEILERQIEDQIDLVDSEGLYPCADCGKKYPVDDMVAATDSPSSPLICWNCAPPEWGTVPPLAVDAKQPAPLKRNVSSTHNKFGGTHERR